MRKRECAQLAQQQRQKGKQDTGGAVHKGKLARAGNAVKAKKKFIHGHIQR